MSSWNICKITAYELFLGTIIQSYFYPSRNNIMGMSRPQLSVFAIVFIDFSQLQLGSEYPLPMLPVSTYTKPHFITAKAAARFMTRRKSGVILFHTPELAPLPAPLVGGMVPAWDSMEALSRNFLIELALSGIRTVRVRTTGLPETETITVVYGLHVKALDMTREQFQGLMESMSHNKRSTTPAELANSLVFASSDQSSGMTGAVLNMTGGKISD
jgi:NAD(P)-dependent dehydrogenase (short-subunit alcohol dehydrogenase family)